MDPINLQSLSMLPDALTSPDVEILVRQLTESVMESNPANRLTQQQISELLASLPRLTETELIALGHSEAACPICFTQLLAVLAEEEMALAMDSPAHPTEELGVTRLKDTCGHVFCRKDIGKWIRDGHDSCPLCRRPLITSSSNDDGTGSPQADRPLEEPRSLDGQQALLLQQMDDALAAMLGHSRRPPRNSGASRDTYDDDRSGFSGMYS